MYMYIEYEYMLDLTFDKSRILLATVKLNAVRLQRRVLEAFAKKAAEHVHHVSFISLEPRDQGLDAVLVGVLGPAHQTPVPLAGDICHILVNAVEVADDGPHRCSERVQVQAVEPDGVRCVGLLVELAQPFDKVLDLEVAPHPRREAHKGRRLFFFLTAGGERRRLAFSSGDLPARTVPDVAIDGLGIGPVCLGGDNFEAVLLNHVLCNLGACRVELGGAVRGIPDEEDLAAAAEAVKASRKGVACFLDGGETFDVGLEKLNGRLALAICARRHAAKVV